MYDANDCLRIIKRIHRPSIVDKVTRKKYEKFKTESKRYNAIYEEIAKCSSQEKDNLEILLKCEKGRVTRLLEFKGFVAVFVSIVSIMISIGTSFFIKMIDTGDSIKNAEILADLLNYNLEIVCYMGTLAIVIYAGLELYGISSLDRNTYLLGVLEKVGNQRKRDK